MTALDTLADVPPNLVTYILVGVTIAACVIGGVSAFVTLSLSRTVHNLQASVDKVVDRNARIVEANARMRAARQMPPRRDSNRTMPRPTAEPDTQVLRYGPGSAT